MTDETPLPERRRVPENTAAVLSASSPDVNAIFQGLVEKFLALPGKIGAFFSWQLSVIWIIAAIGVPAMLAAAPLMDKVYQGRAAERSYQLDMYKLQTDIELKKLDRTMLGEGAMSTLQKISEKIDQQATQVAHQNAKIEGQIQRLSDDFQEMQKAQAKTDRKVGSMQAQIRNIPPPQ